MLKKRILASSMASVMALGSVSVAAFADETKDYGEAVTEKELQEYVDGLEDFIADELPTYGSKQGERFQAAYDHALKVLDDDKSEAADFTAAYQMVKAVKEKLTIYTASQLGKLISDNQKKYDQNNEFNEDLQDNVYTESTYADFTSAFDDATRYVDSDDSMMITDAYIALEDAVAKLSELDTVTKSQFRTALRAYEELEYKMKNYESWRRGVLTVASTTGTSKNCGDLVKKAPSVTFGDLYDIVYGKSEKTFRYWDKTAWKNLEMAPVSEEDEDDHEDEGTWIGSYDIDLSITTEETLQAYIKKCYKDFDEVKNATITSKPEIVAAYNAAVDAVAMFNGWQPDSYKSGSKGSCANLIKKYRPQLVETFNADDIDALIEAINFADGGASGWYEDKDSSDDYDESKDGKKYTLKHDAEDHTLKCNMALYIIKNKDTGLWVVPTSASDVEDCVWKTQADAEEKLKDEAGKDGMTVQKISAGTNLLTYMNFTVMLSTEIDTEISSAQGTYQGKVTAASAIIDTEDSEFSTTWQCAIDGDAIFTADADITGESESVTYYHVKTTGDGSGSSGDKSSADISASNDAVDALKADYDALKTKVTALRNLKAMSGDFEEANGLYGDYLGYDFPDDADAALAAIKDYADGKTISKASGSTTEWTIVWRKLAYALDDLFPVEVKDNLTLSDLKKQIDRAYDFAEQTGDSSLFAKEHMAVVDARQAALDWYKEAKATTGYKTEDEVAGKTLANVHKTIKGKVDDLEKWLKGFAYSYGDIKADIAKIAEAIEKGEVKGDDLKAKLAQCAYDLSVLQPSDVHEEGDADTNVAFDDERVFQAPNRLKTDKQKSAAKPNDYEKNLKKSYEALVKAYDEALTGTAPSGVEGDVDNDGAVTFADVNAVLAAFLKGDTDAAFDVNGDKAVDFEDVNKALDIFLKAQA